MLVSLLTHVTGGPRDGELCALHFPMVVLG